MVEFHGIFLQLWDLTLTLSHNDLSLIGISHHTNYTVKEPQKGEKEHFIPARCEDKHFNAKGPPMPNLLSVSGIGFPQDKKPFNYIFKLHWVGTRKPHHDNRF